MVLGVDDPSRCSPINTCPPNLPIRYSLRRVLLINRVQRGLYEGACISEDIYSIYESVTICVNNNPYLCENNECKLNAHQCNDLTLVCPLSRFISHSLILVDTPYECPDGTCARSKSLCKNGNSCNVLTPYKCRNNECVSVCRIPIRSSNRNLQSAFFTISTSIVSWTRRFLTNVRMERIRTPSWSVQRPMAVL